MSMDISELQREIVDWGIEKGWDFTENDIPEKLMLVVTEISEAMEEFRKADSSYVSRVYWSYDGKKPEGLMVELADAIIRILHIAGKFGVDMTEILRMKMDYNHTRDFRHGGKRA